MAKINKQGIIRYSEYIDECAIAIGYLRTAKNISTRHNTEYDRGLKNLELDVLGAKCELIFADFLTRNNINYTRAELAATTPQCTYDFKVNDIRIDVKGISKDCCNVNQRTHTKKSVDRYVFILPTGNFTARYWIFNSNEIDKWDLIETKAPFYSKKINTSSTLDINENNI